MEGTFFSLIPPLMAILLCMILREAILSLFIGVYIGALLIYDGNPFIALFRTADDILLGAFTDTDHAITIFFTVIIGGLIEVFNRSASARELLHRLSERIRTPRTTCFTIWTSGILFFIDDYANTLIVGHSFRRLSDRVRLSREKLAYLVDTTSAPITSLMIVSTWIGFEISTINDALIAANVQGYTGYGLFLYSIPYRFYPLLALVFSFMICYTGRDFGPMLKAERRARQNDSAEAAESGETVPATRRYALVLIPIVFLVVSSIALLAYDGAQNREPDANETAFAGLIAVFAAADAFRCLLWASILSTVVSFFIHSLLLGEKVLKVFENWLEGCRGMFMICLILLLAWSIGDICSRLETGNYVASLLGEGFDPHWLPLFTFFVAAGISFATGTSFGTMSILIPITMPLAVQLGVDNTTILYGTVASVLGGAIFGDHCSPLSDTTILSSASSGCSVIDHTRTQLPYALVTAAVSALCLALVPIHWITSPMMLLIGILLLFGILLFIGEKDESYEK